MGDVAAGRTAGGRDEGQGRPGRSAQPVLLGALGTASVIVLVFLVALSAGGNAGDPAAPARNAAAVTPVAGDRVRLSISMDGAGAGEVRIRPGGIVCKRSCERMLPAGTRITAVALPVLESTFGGWGHACEGTGDCRLVMDEDRSLTLTFDLSTDPCDPDAPEIDPVCVDESDDPPPDATDEPDPARDREPAARASDCDDGRDNDRDGLTDFEQDPDCTATGSESGAPIADAEPADECSDGIDNDRDGLTDRKQDPDCVTGSTEGGGPSGAPRARPLPECADGRDNDRDGLTDRAQDHGCTADGTEAD